MQLGPTTLSRCGRAARRMRLRQRSLSSRAVAPLPVPAVMTTAHLVPRSPNSTIRRGTVAAGVMMTARSAGWGSSARLFSTGRPSIVPPLTLTRWMSPWKPPVSRLRVTAAPTEPGRALAPIATTDRGTIILSRLRMDMALEERRTIHQRKTRNDDKGRRHAAPAERLAQQQGADQGAKQHGCFTQRRDVCHRPQHERVDRNAVTDIGD